MKRSKYLLITIAAALCGATSMMSRHRADSESKKPTVLQAKSEMVLPIKTMLETSAAPAAENEATVDTQDAAVATPSLAKARPADAEIRKEVAKDPHHVPESLLDFSVVVAGKMKEAKKSFIYAEALFSEFGNCAIQEEAGKQNLAVRAYCLANAKRLVGWYPDLGSKWQKLSDEVGHHLLDLVDLSQG